ncbi:hypothetical protein JAAARDRAFT_37027 [Jaapia argillacea MUCL 33604]|uniref:DUF6593 domain-containing protein n=1 Tax=Jaapia argillacea MUCL 33604 TaxID=933084 RepID=A0A067PLE1_9AGAM|nr:hypothetical protein JAAARDRAFT_37027 [Jaapia argillacea MUCL 33604]
MAIDTSLLFTILDLHTSYQSKRPAKTAPSHKLHLTCNSLRNTTISVDNDTVYYEVVTRFWHPDLTKIFRLDKESREMILIAEIKGVQDKGKGKDYQGVWVRFGDHLDPESDEGWMHENQFVNYDDAGIGGSFLASEGAEYKWRVNDGSMELVNPNDTKAALGSLHPHDRHFYVGRMSKHAVLDIQVDIVNGGQKDKKVAESFDKVIASYLLVERKRRMAKLRLKLERA